MYLSLIITEFLAIYFTFCVVIYLISILFPASNFPNSSALLRQFLHLNTHHMATKLNTCTGCKGSWIRSSDLTQHHLKSKDPRCIKAATQEAARLCGSRPSRRIPAFQLRRHHYTMPRQSSAQSDATEKFTFDGDFYGTYSAEDFPGFEDVIIDGEGEDAEDSAQADDPAALEHMWEPARELQTVGADMEVDDFEDLAESTSRFRSSAGSSLQQLPAHRDGIHVQKFGALAGTPLMSTKLPTHHRSSAYEHYQSKIPDGEANIWAPFISQMDWEVAQWAKMRGSGSTAFSDLLAIEGVCNETSVHLLYTDFLVIGHRSSRSLLCKQSGIEWYH